MTTSESRVKKLRLRLGLSQAAMGARLGLSQPAICNLENGQAESGPLAILLDQMEAGLSKQAPPASSADRAPAKDHAA
jgi:transcriptional regulator with XRE-family HTH domain